jgi:hypothetical protein
MFCNFQDIDLGQYSTCYISFDIKFGPNWQNGDHDLLMSVVAYSSVKEVTYDLFRNEVGSDLE